MGYIEGLLGGYVSRHREIEQDQIAEDTRQREREGKMFEALINSPDPEIRALAGTGIVEWAKPRRTAGGPSGWLTGYAKNPIYPQLLKAMQTEKPHKERVTTPGLGSKQRSGFVSPPPVNTTAQLPAYTQEDLQPDDSLAQPETSPTEVGSAPMKPPSSVPRPTPPSATSYPSGFGPGTIGIPPPTPGVIQPGLQPTTGPGAQVVGPSGATRPAGPAAGTPQAPVTSGTPRTFAAEPGTPEAAYHNVEIEPAPRDYTDVEIPADEAGSRIQSQSVATPPPSVPGVANVYNEQFVPGPAVGRTDIQTVYRRPQAFPTKTDLAAQEYEGRFKGEYDNAVRMAQAAGHPNPEQWALEYMQSQSATGGNLQNGRTYQQADGTWVQEKLHPKTGQLMAVVPATTPGTTSNAPPNLSEMLAHKLFGKDGESPKGILNRLSQKQTARLMEEETIFRAQRKAESDYQTAVRMQDAPLTAQARSALTESYAKEWKLVQAPVEKMRRAYTTMLTGQSQYKAGAKGQGAETIRVTFEEILDPDSVVREGEYARQGLGLSLVQRMQGYYDKYFKGGGEIPEGELDKFVETAKQFVLGLENFNASEKQRLSTVGYAYGIPADHIFGPGAPSVATPPPASPYQAPGAQVPRSTPGPGGGITIDSPMTVNPDGTWR